MFFHDIIKFTFTLFGGCNVSKRFWLVLTLLFVLISTSTIFATSEGSGVTYKGKVISVEPMGSQPFQEEWENQLITLKLLSGPQKSEIISLHHTLTGHPYFDLNVKKGDKVIVQVEASESHIDYYIVDFARQMPMIVITALFILLVVIIGGHQGIKAIVSLFGMGIVIVTMILPLVLKGYNPILVTVGLSSILTGLFIVFVGGFTKKTVAATTGTIGGLLAAGLLAVIIGKASYLTGLSSGEAQILQYMDSSIDFRGLLFSGIIIGALGAILDVGISIASAMEQIKEADPKTDFKTLFTRGILVGRDLIATMSNTLILAYVGSSLPLLLLFKASESNWGEVFNMELIGAEVVRAMAGSIGLTLAIPITAFISAFLFVKPENKGKDLSN